MLICPHCGVDNPVDATTCSACARKLLVISSGGVAPPPSEDIEASVTLEEHLIERVSLLEEALRNSIDGLQRALSALRRLERSALVSQAGLAAVEDVLTSRRLVDDGDLRGRWNQHLRASLMAMEKRDVLDARREIIRADFAGGDQDRFESMLDRASEAFAALDSEAAVEALERALELDPGNPQLASLVGELDFLAGRRERALEHFTSALERDPQQVDALVYSGILLHQAGDLDAAENKLRRSVEIRPQEFLGWFALGSVYGDLGELREAAVYLERAIEIDRIPSALSLLGRIYRRMGKLGRAAATLEEALQADPALNEARYELGRTYAARGWVRRGLEALAAALERHPAAHRHGVLSTEVPFPDDPGEALRQAVDLAAAGQFQRAGRAAETALSGADRPRVRLVAAAVLIESLRSEGRLREGLEWGERLLEVDDTFAATVACCGIAYNLAELEQDLDRALELANRGLAAAPAELQAHAGAALGWVHYKRGELDQARERLEKAVELGENAAHLKLLGVVCLAQGEGEAAETFLDRAESALETHHRPDLHEQWFDRLWAGGGSGGDLGSID